MRAESEVCLAQFCWFYRRVVGEWVDMDFYLESFSLGVSGSSFGWGRVFLNAGVAGGIGKALWS